MEVSATEFKAKCLALLDRVYETGEVVTVTKRGKVVAEVRSPSHGIQKFSPPGFAKDEILILGDIMEPLDVDWEANLWS